MKYTFVIYGRPKSPQIDRVLKQVNETLEAFGEEGRITYSGLLATTVISTKKRMTDIQLSKVKKMVAEEFSKKFADVSVKLQSIC